MGPLKGLRIIEMGGIGPAPFAGMMLADMGAEVILVERKSDLGKPNIPDINRRGKKSVALDLKQAEDVEQLLKLMETCDALFEGYRPGVMERLGLGPDICAKRNPKLIYARMTGWGQVGPLAHAAGHDINYISLTGVLNSIGRKGQKPIPPLNLVGDYGGGAMFLVTGLLAAYIEAQKSGKGQVIDVAMTDGSALLMSIFNTLEHIGMWPNDRGENFLDSGSHYYNTYETQDKKYISIGAIEPKFYKQLIKLLGLDHDEYDDQNVPRKWAEYTTKFETIFRQKTRDEWCSILEGTDVCFAPVLSLGEAAKHPHNTARQTYITIDELTQPAPAPRFGRTPSTVQSGPVATGQNQDLLKDL